LRTKFLVFLAIILLFAPAVFSQSKETGAIRGVVTDDQNVPLPGVNMTLTGRTLMGMRTFVTDAMGEFRFPALPPGEYELKAELSGFGTVIRERVRLNTTTTLTLEIEMKPAALSEEVTVIAQSPTVDVKSTETASVTLSNEILRNVPYSQFTSDIVNLAPGVSEDSAYGASESTGIAYSMDGVNVADPEGGSAWVFSDHNIIEEAKVMGIGLPAEYGNFTGVIFNLVTKSGGNQLSGHFEFNFQGYQEDSKFWQANNNQAYIDDFPTLSSPSSKLMDVNGHMGGRIIRDKLWFYTGAQFYRTQDRPTGFPEDRDYKQPRFFIKFTSQLTSTLNMSAMFQTTAYQGQNRGAGSTVSPEACLTQDSPDWLVGFNLTKILSPKTFFDLKFNSFAGRYYLDPEVGFAPYRHSVEVQDGFEEFAGGRLNGWRYDSYGSFGYYDRARTSANASMTHYAEDFLAGSHEFKFGAEIERSASRNRWGYTGSGGQLGDAVRYWDLFGYGVYDYVYSGNYLAYQYEGYDTNTRYTRLEAFVQDSWQIGKRLNLSLGLRFSQNWGDVKGISGTVFNTHRIAPRLGFTFDIFGDKSTILKAHYGQFTEAMLTAYHEKSNPASVFSDFVGYYFIPDDDDPTTTGGDWYHWFTIPPQGAYPIDPDLKHPYMTQWTIGIERDLFKDTSIGITYINRRWNDLIGRYDRAADYVEDTVTVDYPDGSSHDFTVYDQTEESLEVTDYIVTNLRKSAEYPWILEDVYRKYEGIEILFNKRFSNRWQLLASYVLSRTTGTWDNTFGGDIGWGANPSNPNNWINAKGNMTNDPTHMVKIQGTYVLPLDISLTGYFWAITGDSWTTTFRTDRYTQGRIDFYAEQAGSHHYPIDTILNLRLEKIFTLASRYRLGVILDLFNVFNNNTINSWGTRIGNSTTWYSQSSENYTPSTQGHMLYGISMPRQARIGIRLIF
jgi:hypothetical protein